jgi:hypothetical protein
MIMSRIILLGGAAALALLLVVLLRVTTSREAAGSSSDSVELARLHDELAGLRERVAASGRSATLAMRMAADRPAPAEPAAAPEHSAASEPAGPKPVMTGAEIRARLSDRFSTEQPDLTWSKPALALLDSHLHAGLPEGSHLVSLECHRTMCRVEAQHRSMSVYDDFVHNAFVFRDGGWQGPSMTQIVNRGPDEVTSVGYLLREGESFAAILDP